MSLFHSMRDLLLYGGLTQEQFHMVREDADKENIRSLQVYAPIGSVAFCVLLLASTFMGNIVGQNTFIYMGACIAMGILALVSHACTRSEHPDRSVVRILTHLFMIVLYVFAICVSMRHVEYPAVSSIVFLLVTPLLFVSRPLSVAIQTALATAAVCAVSVALKDPVIAGDDVWNAITFGGVGILANVFVTRTKFRSLYQANEIVYLSETDVLTGLKNRNCYESRLEDYPRGDARVLVCAYADADGLHELNNTKGHDAGDALVCAIANEMQKLFGVEHTFRIGGDEFVGFVPDGDVEDVRRLLGDMRERLLAAGHRVSCGAATVEARTADMRSLVRNAEKEMYSQKFAAGAGRPREEG